MRSPIEKYSNKLLKVILLTGLLAGVLDATAAILDFYISTGKSPVIIFTFIASGILGKQAFVYGNSIAWLGLVLHFCIAIIFTAFYFIVYPRLKFLQWNKINSAVIYGIFVWIVMNMIVVPLSKTPPLSFHPLKALLAVIILIICIGIPDSFIASAFYKKQKSNIA